MPSVSRATREPDATPWPDDPPDVPARSRARREAAGDRLPAGWELIEIDGAPIYGATFAASYARARLRDPNGNERRVILRRLKPDSPGSIIWEGDIRILGRYSTFRISPGRVLKSPDWSDYLIVESENRMGIKSPPVPIAAMDLKQTQPKAFWPDQLKVALSGRLSHIGEFIRLSGEEWDKPSSLMIRGQGPVYLRDGSPLPNKLLDHSLVFVTRSRVFDTNGETRDVIPDLSQIPETYSYYDLTPEAEITPEEIARGIARFRDAYGECPGFPVIPAAFLGQLFAGSLAAIDPRFFTAIHQTGIKGSGKTRYAARWDAVQSRDSRDLRTVKPVLNLGDTTGTVKGPKYRMADFGGFTVTVDDVLKDGNSPAQITAGSESVSNLLRSFDSGGAALAGVDYARNEVGGRESPALHSSIRVMSEIPVTGGSTLDRMLVMPALAEPWGRGNIFHVETSSRLSEPGAVEDMHRAYSAYVQWVFRRIGTDAADAYAKARAETESWGIDSRYAERYAGAVAGHDLFGRYCAALGVDMSAEIRAAVDALRECARAQASASVPLGERFAADLRRAVMLERVSFPGAPAVDADGIAASYGVPWVMGEPVDDNGAPRNRRIAPEISLAEIGMQIFGDSKPVVPARAMIGGYSMPPRDNEKTGGPKGHKLTAGWYVVCKRERFAEIVRIVSLISGRAYDPDSVMDSLRVLERGDIFRVSIAGKQERGWNFDLMWTLKNREE